MKNMLIYKKNLKYQDYMLHSVFTKIKQSN